MASDTHERLASGIAAKTSEADATEVRIIPIPEGERTTGLSGEETVWPRETLKESVDRGVWQGAKLLKARPTPEQHKEGVYTPAGPDEIVGKVTDATYEDGVGPVLSASLLDEHLAKLVEHDLVTVSPDLTRELDEYDEQLQAKPAAAINDVPYVTILDVGASSGASIEPATAEALGVHPDRLAAPGSGDGSGEQNPDSDDDDDVESPSDEPAEPGRDSDTDMTDEKIQELQEQLAAARQETDELREEKESLESETDELESELSEKEQKLEDLEDEKASLEDENQSFGRVLAARVAGDSPLDADSLAERYTVEELADTVVKHEGLADEEARSSDDYDPIAQVQEQLAQAPAHRGQTPEGGEGGNLTEEQLAAADGLATSVLAMQDVQRAQNEQLSPREYVKREHDVDPAQYDDEQALRAAVESAGGED